jgi:hypothetical protein
VLATVTSYERYSVIWGTVFVGVRLFAGAADPYWTIDKILVSNLFQPSLALFNIAALLGVLWWCAIAGIRRAPAFVRRTALVMPPYLVVVAIWRLWYIFEPRSAAT